MAGRLAGNITTQFIGKEVTKRISKDVQKYKKVVYDPICYNFTLNDENRKLQGGYSAARMPAPNNLGAFGVIAQSFFKDFYFRIHTKPQKLDLQTVASSQTRQISVWNAYPNKSANLDDITISDSAGIEVSGQPAPFVMRPLKELIYDVTIGTSGSPNINSEIQFNFSNVQNPLPILVVGTRAIKFDIVPESPVTETWEWLTDNMVATDGTEQRLAIRGEMPRVELNIKVKFVDTDSIRRFYSNLISAGGRLWIPEFQYATRITENSNSGELRINYDNKYTDIRNGDYILIQTPINSALLEVKEIDANGAVLSAPLGLDIPKGSLVVPGSPALINNQSSIDRMAVDTVAETNLVCKMIRQRTTLNRTGAAPVFPTFKSMGVIDKRPLANDLIKDEVSTGQISIDNQIGLQNIISRWDYSRIGGPRSFKVDRIQQPEQMDYWKAAFAYLRGQCRTFWMPSFRTDLHIAEQPSDAANAIIVSGSEYAEKVFKIPTHQFIEIETNAGLHRVKIVSAVVNNAGDSALGLEDALPSGDDWRIIKRISFLLPMRISDDKVQWKHYGLESILTFSVRTAEI